MDEIVINRGQQRGATMIEVLVTLVIIAIGLLGLAQLQSKLQVSDVEAYQRAQALVLLQDMASRLAANRSAAASYVTGGPIGTGSACSTTTASSTRSQIDRAQWCRSLKGVAESAAGGVDAGAVVGARGCVAALGGNAYLITVAWQGTVPLDPPPAGVPCGTGSYNGASGSSCVSDRCRRVVTTVVRIGTLN